MGEQETAEEMKLVESGNLPKGKVCAVRARPGESNSRAGWHSVHRKDFSSGKDARRTAVRNVRWRAGKWGNDMLAECLLITASLCNAIHEPAPVIVPTRVDAVRVQQGSFRPVEERVFFRRNEDYSPAMEVRKAPRWFEDKKFMALSGAAYGMAYADVVRTVRLRNWASENGRNFHERNPLTRWAVYSTPAMLAGTGVLVTGANYLSWRMKTSSGGWRKVWWLPQVVAIGLNATGFLTTSRIPGGTPGLAAGGVGANGIKAGGALLTGSGTQARPGAHGRILQF